MIVYNPQQILELETLRLALFIIFQLVILFFCFRRIKSTQWKAFVLAIIATMLAEVSLLLIEGMFIFFHSPIWAEKVESINELGNTLMVGLAAYIVYAVMDIRRLTKQYRLPKSQSR